MNKQSEEHGLPTSKKWLVDGFCRFTRRMVAKHFISFGIHKVDLDLEALGPEIPIVVYANHASWWDPICAMLIRQTVFPNRVLYAPIDALALKDYRIMAQLGFYGLQLHTHSGAADFLATTKRILKSKNASIWITPEGRFTDVRDHSVPLMPGLSHLAARVPGVVFLPLALEYAFWDQSRPKIFARFGAAIGNEHSVGGERSKSEWNAMLTDRLRQTQMKLAQNVIDRDSHQFEYIVANRPVRLGWYDFFRSWVAKMEGKPFDPRHQA
ncbi:MAG: lysophospholipid acyltransferase family protein [Pirellula sp.]